MNWYVIAQALSVQGGVVAASLIFPTLVALHNESSDLFAFAFSFVVSLSVCSSVFFYIYRKRKNDESFNERIGVGDACIIVTFSWIVASLIGSMPLMISGTVHSFTDAFFESMSGFTTTGASIIKDVTVVPHGVLLWRSLTHWLGGLGIIVTSLAILPFVGISGMELYKAESPSPVPEKMTPRLHKTALYLWEIYFVLTAVEVLLLWYFGMTLFEAVTYSFSTLATGGFAVHNNSIAHYGNAAIEWVIIVFMYLAGVNFTLHFLFLKYGPSAYWKDDEFIVFTVLVVGVALTCAAVIIKQGLETSWLEAIRHGLFQTLTLITTTGFGVSDTAPWHPGLKFLLIITMFIGGCAGSTGGGIKVMRVMMVWKAMKNSLEKMLHPRQLFYVWINGKPQRKDIIAAVMAFFAQYMFLTAIGVLVMSFAGYDLLSAMSGAVSCLSNVGQGIGEFGASGSGYSVVPSYAKWVLAILMLIGRLELSTVLVLLLPAMWRR